MNANMTANMTATPTEFEKTAIHESAHAVLWFREEALAALARTFGGDPAFQEQLFNARSPAHAYEILYGEESEDFNYFLGDPARS